MVDLAPDLTAREPIGIRVELIGSDSPGQGKIIFHELGVGRPVIMFASLGREASDFNELAQSLADNGYHVLLVQPPYIDDAIPSARQPDLFDLAKDVQPILARLDQPAILLGHAFGNRLARATATQYPNQTAGVILLAAGGKRPIAKKASTALIESFNPALPDDTRRKAVRYGFFAHGNAIPDHWMRGWHSKTALIQGDATRATPAEDWWAGGTTPMLVISGQQDTIAPPQDTIDLLEAEFPDRITAIRLPGAGHALLPEQPDEIANSVLTWLDALPTKETD